MAAKQKTGLLRRAGRWKVKSRPAFKHEVPSGRAAKHFAEINSGTAKVGVRLCQHGFAPSHLEGASSFVSPKELQSAAFGLY
jgi:hypothetical protein